MIVNNFCQFLVVKRTTWEALNVDQWKKVATSIWSMKMETTAVIVERNILLKYICNVESNRYGIVNNYCTDIVFWQWFYYSITEFVFWLLAKQSAIFTRERWQEGEKRGSIHAWAEYYLQPNTFTGEKCLIGRRATTWHCQIQNGGNTSIVCLFQWKED